MKRLEEARKAKIDNILNKIINYREGAMSRKEWLKLQHKNNKAVEVISKVRNGKYKQTVICEYKISGEKITKTEFNYYETLYHTKRTEFIRS